MTNSWSFTVPIGHKPWTPNRRMHHFAKAALVAEMRHCTAVVARSHRNKLDAPAAAEKRHVRMVVLRGYSQQLMDDDNCVAMLKPFVDGLRDAGWIVNDSREWMTREVDQEIDRKNGPAVRVEIQIPECAPS